jgi:acetolactate synthase I/II/III large subunit
MHFLIKHGLVKRYRHFFTNRKNLLFSNIENNNISTRIVSGSEIVYNSLIRNNVKHAFIYSGGSIMPIIDKLYNSDINYTINSHEQNCGHAATGYTKTSKKKCAVLVTSGPGFTNTITPLLDATNDSTPLVIISGQVAKKAIGTNAFQEAPSVALSKNVTKWSYEVENIEELSDVIDEAYNIAYSGKNGAVHIDIPKCISSGTIEISEEEYAKMINVINENGNNDSDNDPNNDSNNDPNNDSENDSENDTNNDSDNDTNNDSDNDTNNDSDNDPNNDNSYMYRFNKAIDVINNSKKPILYIGQGCKDSYKLLREFAITSNIPVTSTIHGNGIFDEDHDLSLQWCGMHGSPASNYALQEADTIIALGSRFDDRTTGLVEKYAPRAFEAYENGNGGIIHVNIEKSEINKVVNTHYNFNEDCGQFLKKAIKQCKYNERQEWINRINELKINYKFPYNKHKSRIFMENVLTNIYEKTKNLEDNVIFTTGVGNHQMQTYQYIKSHYPGKIISSGSLGVMGAGLPYAIGAQIANPNKMVICIDGDSSFNMTLTDMKTIVENNLPVKIAIMNNESQMMVTVWEKLFFDQRYTATLNKKNPCFKTLAKGYGIKSLSCNNINLLENVVDEFINYNDGPILCEFKIERSMCLPLVAPGKALDEMILEDNEELKIEEGLAPS